MTALTLTGDRTTFPRRVRATDAVVTGARDLTTAGAVWVIAQALAAAGSAELQITGLRKIRTTT
ncbi:hypothetical protein E1295_03350 [Nonomuraea mesophila]|uniref:Uncharacterized protein n=1 Tax=Nonomuraea mesophila TaxID=2530382 RepID=A0A4R5FXS1_9ACTN|nr:hypothetical protein [Nonomuraea mesophila]TDE59279.1 hypothetical protein E1295_03350 [Nonomuraea mesophila]